MSSGDIIGAASVGVAVVVLAASLIRDAAAKRRFMRDEGAADAKLKDGFDLVNHKLEDLLRRYGEINGALSRLNEQSLVVKNTVENAGLKSMPAQLTEIASSVKSAHKRLDAAEGGIARLTKQLHDLGREVSENRAKIK